MADQEQAIVAQHGHLVEILLLVLGFPLPLASLVHFVAARQAALVAVDEVLAAVGDALVCFVGPIAAVLMANTRLDVAVVGAGPLVTTSVYNGLFPDLRLFADVLELVANIYLIFLLKLGSEQEILAARTDQTPPEKQFDGHLSQFAIRLLYGPHQDAPQLQVLQVV